MNPSHSPFLSHAFLAGLERHESVGDHTGWQSKPSLAFRDGRLIAALPLYEKTNSFGEFVFDWAWAEAYQRLARPYYPKLVVAVPFTPVAGERLLAANSGDRSAAFRPLLADLEAQLAERDLSSAHWLFTTESDCRDLTAAGYLPRIDCRFYWHNRDYRDFDDFLSIFSARQRKNIRRERRKVQAAGIRFDWHTGAALANLDWGSIHRLCAGTFYRHAQQPYLNADFFADFARRHPDQLLVNTAHSSDKLVAASIFFRDQKTLYGRYWGSNEQIDCLHFEACYYQGIDYAIAHGLSGFDPGTQGEHKLRRGFAPLKTWSAHLVRDPVLRAPIANWLTHERQLVERYIADCRERMPFATLTDSGW